MNKKKKKTLLRCIFLNVLFMKLSFRDTYIGIMNRRDALDPLSIARDWAAILLAFSKS